jgi:hypothetical protein
MLFPFGRVLSVCVVYIYDVGLWVVLFAFFRTFTHRYGNYNHLSLSFYILFTTQRVSIYTHSTVAVTGFKFHYGYIMGLNGMGRKNRNYFLPDFSRIVYIWQLLSKFISIVSERKTVTNGPHGCVLSVINSMYMNLFAHTLFFCW